jgi:xylulokinase
MVEEMDDGPTDMLVLPYFSASGTPYLDPRPLGGIVGLALSSGRGTIIRGLVEGLACEMRLHAELLGDSGVRFNEVHVTGPAAASRKWCQLKADVLGHPVQRQVGVNAAALGAAMLAGIGAGVYEDTADAVESCVRPDDEVWPSGERVGIYARKFAAYRRLYPALRAVMS